MIARESIDKEKQMNRNKLKIIAAAAVCALIMTSCGNKENLSDEVSVGGSQDGASVSSQAEGAQSSQAGNEGSSNDTSSKEEEDVVIYDPELIKLAQDRYNAKLIEGDDLKTLFAAEYTKEGTGAYCAGIKTVEVFDPFDDMLKNVISLADVKRHAQIMMLTQFIETKDGMRADGLLMAIGFGCADEDEAKNVFTYVFNEDMQGFLDEENYEDPDFLKYEIAEDGNSVLMSFGDEDYMSYYGYYRVGSNIYVIGVYDTRFTDTPVNGEYKQEYDYVKEMGDICEKFGVESPDTLRK